MRVILTLVTLVSLTLSTQAMAEGQDMYCSSNDVSATLFLHASRNQYVFKSSENSPKINDNYVGGSTQVADNKNYSIKMIGSKQVLIRMKTSGVEFVLSCK